MFAHFFLMSGLFSPFHQVLMSHSYVFFFFFNFHWMLHQRSQLKHLQESLFFSLKMFFLKLDIWKWNRQFFIFYPGLKMNCIQQSFSLFSFEPLQMLSLETVYLVNVWVRYCLKIFVCHFDSCISWFTFATVISSTVVVHIFLNNSFII